MAESIVISKTIGIGDGGLPFWLVIDVEFEREGDTITVIEAIERECPYDNPPEKWCKRIEEIVDDFFYDENPKSLVIFK